MSKRYPGGTWGTRYARNRARQAFNSAWDKGKKTSKKDEDEGISVVGFFAILFLIAILLGALTK
ncbi:MAG: hypothetical protein IKD01_05335 [Oscillospiraceae bacterium]|nr:hypothetical protein [Oscillospiraceae bacterium]